MDGAARDHAEVEISKANRDETAPGKEHVALVQKADPAPSGVARASEGRAGEAVEFASREVAERVARKGVKREQGNVQGQNESADTDAEVAVEIEGYDGVVPEEQDEDDRNIEEIAVKILENEGKSCLALVIAFRWLANGAGRRIEQKGPIESLAVVVAGGAKAEWTSKDEERRRDRPPMMQRVNERRIEGRQIGPPLVELSFKGAQRGVDAKSAHQNDDGDDFDPPSVAAQRASEPRFRQEGWRASHLGTSRVAVSKSKTRLLQTDYIQEAAERLI